MHTSLVRLSIDVASPDTLIRMKFAYGMSYHAYRMFLHDGDPVVAVALVTLWAYDYIITLDEELPFITRSTWRVVKYLYLVCRYVPFLYLAVVSSRSLESHPSLSMCQTMYSLNSYLGMLIIVSAESIFFVRTYIIWDRSKRILWAFIISIMFLLTPIVGILVKYNSSIIGKGSSYSVNYLVNIRASSVTNWIGPGILGCSKTGETSAVLYVYVLMVIAELEILCLTLYRAIVNYRRERGANVLRVLVQHNIFYFGCGVASSVVLIVVIATFPASYSDLVSSVQITVHAALVTRMHRALWGYNEDYAHADEFSLTTFSAPPPLRTVQSAVGYVSSAATF
ncbi:hypothetical protein CY34DRAFT_11827 [Suillus luteus UH-Slu-Lm8-n1]|uniref:Unplaced genomic scaffold CY34scaffold_85, whole genome shotgun sequence n=1 Tax=Suillus luteus UH-Slu-Lm8-n1 TaxID=930992 RepID=A0A0D0AZX3_9AGAM|nr:hypothetical protein CY34DRAFT_11827 [Suillus luteus UH-Slu-Lm8-n1]